METFGKFFRQACGVRFDEALAEHGDADRAGTGVLGDLILGRTANALRASVRAEGVLLALPRLSQLMGNMLANLATMTA